MMRAFLRARFLQLLPIAVGVFLPVAAFAQQAQSFTDVPADHPVYQAVEYLQEKGIVTGYGDGTFQPNRGVNRAEALKLIVAPLKSAESLQQFSTSPFSDVPAGSWFLPYVESARTGGIVDGPPVKPAFLPGNGVLKAEFIKMLALAHGQDPVGAYSEIRLPFTTDVSDTNAWFYPYLRFGIASSMTMVGADGLLHPGRALTRGDCALILHRYLMYKEGRRTQALLSEAESEIIVILGALERNDIVNAEYASARALVAARGALTSKPDDPLVQGALKTTEAFRALVRAYRAGLNKDYNEVLRLTGDGWNLAARAKELSPSLGAISDQIQKIAQSMAESARQLTEGAPQ